MRMEKEKERARTVEPRVNHDFMKMLTTLTLIDKVREREREREEEL